jgi:hypothetical protein
VNLEFTNYAASLKRQDPNRTIRLISTVQL